MKKLNIYWIDAEPIYPVCEAGAVVIAGTPEEALTLANSLYKPKEPELIGTANSKSPRVVTLNDGNY